MSSNYKRGVNVEHFKSDTIKVVVGTAPASCSAFIVHRSLICGVSPFFRAACNREWREGKTGVVELPEDNPGVFGAFLQYIYTDGCDALNPTETLRSLDTGQVKQAINLYVLADKLGVVQLANDATSTLWSSYHDRDLKIEDIEMVYATTPTNSALRRLVVDEVVRDPKRYRRGWGNDLDRLKKLSDFMVDLGIARIQGSDEEAQKRWNEGPCEYWRPVDGA
ncbi:hypothetical protein NA57DRAFT_79290 [Rhizodiscina lignyota]|uniref:BTB domain-containing protein n=1 Tax=Rhizodiscina lignyota TaxID=1504668 RepID=A0A9P4I5J9_9PEZI|nr:hypothetical protein NA57DRAFT_79290 [Rhizodiscina lignyota]